ncbi:MAG: plastocyanin/azurin family copper-binding protein [Chloroflexaceae bacterium]|nr:plastocyanin/azurin family copper-binding protein [Chloroflexaceae bacterium]
MSWRAPQGGGSRIPGFDSTDNVFSGGSAGGPPLLSLIIAALAVGLVGLFLAIAFGGSAGQGTAAVPQPTRPPAVLPTAPPAVQPTAPPAGQPTAAPAATTAPAQPTTAPSGGAAGIPTEPLGPALVSGTGTPIEIGTDAALLVFDQQEVRVPNGPVTLTFKNLATAVQHNWVLVQGGDDVASAVNDAAQAQVRVTRNAAGAVPPADTPGLLVAAPMLDPGESVTFTFQPPGPGTYEFICTFPGHYVAGMKGVLVVE